MGSLRVGGSVVTATDEPSGRLRFQDRMQAALCVAENASLDQRQHEWFWQSGGNGSPVVFACPKCQATGEAAVDEWVAVAVCLRPHERGGSELAPRCPDLLLWEVAPEYALAAKLCAAALSRSAEWRRAWKEAVKRGWWWLDMPVLSWMFRRRLSRRAMEACAVAAALRLRAIVLLEEAPDDRRTAAVMTEVCNVMGWLRLQYRVSLRGATTATVAQWHELGWLTEKERGGPQVQEAMRLWSEAPLRVWAALPPGRG